MSDMDFGQALAPAFDCIAAVTRQQSVPGVGLRPVTFLVRWPCAVAYLGMRRGQTTQVDYVEATHALTGPCYPGQVIWPGDQITSLVSLRDGSQLIRPGKTWNVLMARQFRGQGPLTHLSLLCKEEL